MSCRYLLLSPVENGFLQIQIDVYLKKWGVVFCPNSVLLFGILFCKNFNKIKENTGKFPLISTEVVVLLSSISLSPSFPRPLTSVPFESFPWFLYLSPLFCSLSPSVLFSGTCRSMPPRIAAVISSPGAATGPISSPGLRWREPV